MILLIDNYDSFTYNLYQYMGIFTDDIKVVRNDEMTIDEIKELNPDKIVLSPGPKSPKDAGVCMDVMAMRHKRYPVIGLQFHPESIYTEHGKRMIENFVNGLGGTA